MNEIQLINWLATKCYFKIWNSFSGVYMVPELVVWYIEAKIRLKNQIVRYKTKSKVEVYYALEDLRKLVEEWYKENAPEYL